MWGVAGNFAPYQVVGAVSADHPGSTLSARKKHMSAIPSRGFFLHTFLFLSPLPFLQLPVASQKPGKLTQRTISWYKVPEGQGFPFPLPGLCSVVIRLSEKKPVGEKLLWNIMRSNFVKIRRGMLFIPMPCQALSQHFLHLVEYVRVISTKRLWLATDSKIGICGSYGKSGHWWIV